MTPLGAVTGDTTSLLVSLALNAATAKHYAIAQNIANANNEGYRPVRVDFDARLAFFKDRLLDRRYDAASAGMLETLRPATATTVARGSETEKVRLDVEMAKMAQNTVYYQALLAAKGKLTSLLRTAITGGR